ncbi:HAMP domain-containing histidine kinase [Pyxidicoccus parkwayensis]|uniref:Signal transduction histidine-protein kinase/phosphatase MprB n=1 Tax=Pyxidicoccus parkwayensis TaxID=2813578 RepID=A0ABX7NMU9_9BACT|nr:HAMP domain-containing sensor histidine kinase [Pyxidicoccus parkwaysis]QSQ19983.1 HAMP domain-containing histidine kinase [Pyxidicoccus parkwaysis]
MADGARHTSRWRDALGSLSARLLVAFLFPTLLFVALAGTAVYQLARAILEEELGAGLSAVAAATASQVNGERMLTVEPGDDVTGTRTWRNLVRALEGVREASGVRRVYAVDTQGRVRVDVGGGLPVGVEMPELARDRLELARVFAGERAASQVLFTGTDGHLYKTGYAPVRQDGRVVGAVGVEGSAAFFGPLKSLSRTFAIMGTVALAALAVIALLTARGLAWPLRRLMDSALRIGRGDLTTPVPPEPTREIGVLARELEVMRGALESRDRQLKMMLAGVAHEVRNPIGGIALFSGILQEDLQAGAHSEAGEHVKRIQREVAYLQRIVEDFLAFAREQPLARAPVEAPVLLSGACELLAAEAGAREVSVEVDAAPALLEADGSLLTAALVNLVKNAVQASPRGGRVRVSGTTGEGRYTIQVRDTGPGVPEPERERIFEPFFTTREKGTGLGLPLARKIALAHGGDLRLASAPGDTTFILTLPLNNGSLSSSR